MIPALAALALVLALGAAPAAQTSELVDGIAAQVGNEIVLVSEVAQVAAPAEAQLRKRGAGERELAVLRAEILERLIERALIRRVVHRAELSATAAEVDEAIAAIASENDLRPEQLRASVEAQGMPFDTYRERIRGEIEQSKVINGMVAARVRVEEREVRAHFEKEFANQPRGGEEVRLRHILVALDPEVPATKRAACSKVERGLARIRAGEPFGEVAEEISEVNPRRGGDIGWLHMTSLADWMVAALAGMQPGEISGVLETTFGCNLLELVERRPWEPISYEQAREALRRELFHERMAKEYDKFMDSLRKQTYIERKGIFAEAATLRPDAEDVDDLLELDAF
jgi:peptidyl-prolyl cis-trans isomerase SurA